MGLFSSAISAAAQIAIAEETNQTNHQIAREVNQTNRDLAQQENAFNERMWNLSNQYNEPAKQVQRYLKAGLSPAAAAQSVAGSPSQPIQSASLANQQIGNPMVAPDLSGLSGMNIIGAARELAETLNEFEKVKKTRSETQSIDIDNLFAPQRLMTETDVRNWQRNLSMQEFAYNLKSNPYKLESLKYQTKQSKYTAQGAKIANQIQKQNLALGWQMFGFLEKQNPLSLEKMQAEIKSVIAQKDKALADTQKAVADTQVANAQAANINQQTEGVKSENITKRVESILSQFGSPQTTSQRIGALITSGQLDVDKLHEFLDSTRNYLKSGGRKFSGTPDMRNYYHYIINEGEANSMETPIWSHGTFWQGLNIPADFIGNIERMLKGGK